MAYEEDGIVWKAFEEGELKGDDSNDVWDDTALIKAYDRAVAKLKDEIHSESSENTDSPSGKRVKRKTKRNQNKEVAKKLSWVAGDKCLALFSEDNLYYEATILSINLEARTAYVRYDYYENEEEVKVDQLLSVESKADLEPVTSETFGSEQSFNTENEEKTSKAQESDTKVTNDWCVSDLCYVHDDEGNCEQAVLNSFISSKECNVTFICSRKKKKVNVSQLKSTLPKNKNKGSKEHPMPHSPWNPPTLSSHDMFARLPSHMFGFPGMMSPGSFPPGMMSNAGASSAFPQLPSFSEWNHFYPSRLPSVSRTPPPPPPPPPMLSNEVIAGDEEALANMLMSWYMSGYHTGYYQGISQQKKQPSQQHRKK